MASFLETIRRPFRGSPKFEIGSQEEAVSLLRDNFQDFVTTLQKIDPELLEKKTLPKDEAWKLCFSVAQATAILYKECPALPLPEKLQAIIDSADAKDSEKLKVHPSWYTHGFTTTAKPEANSGTNFFEADGKDIVVATHYSKREARYSAKDPSLLGIMGNYDLSLSSESQGKKIEIATSHLVHPRVTASFTDPRENLVSIFPRQDKLGTSIAFGELVGAGPVVLMEEKDKGVTVSGQESTSAAKALVIAKVANYVLTEWSTQRDISDIRNW